MSQDYLGAAGNMLELVRHGLTLDVIDVETAGWLIGLHGEALPLLPEPAATHARLAATLAAGDTASAVALLHARLPKPGNERLLIHACHLGGHAQADTLLDVALAHPNAWFNGAMLASTSRPQQLLAHLDICRGLPISMPDIVTIAELVLHGQRIHHPYTEAEALWRPLLDAPVELARHAQFRTAHLRFLARHDLQAARAWLLHYASTYPRNELFIGAVAVLARMACADPSAAVALLESSGDEADLSSWLPALSWGFEIPGEAHPIVARLLDSPDPETGLDLLIGLARTPEWDRLQRAWHNTAGLEDRAERVVRGVAPALMQLHAAGNEQQVETLRCVAQEWLGNTKVINGRLAASDLLLVLGAPGLPPLVPWGMGADLP